VTVRVVICEKLYAGNGEDSGRDSRVGKVRGRRILEI